MPKITFNYQGGVHVIHLNQSQINRVDVGKRVFQEWGLKNEEFSLVYKDQDNDEITAEIDEDFEVAKVTMMDQEDLLVFELHNIQGCRPITLQQKIVEKIIQQEQEKKKKQEEQRKLLQFEIMVQEKQRIAQQLEREIQQQQLQRLNQLKLEEERLIKQEEQERKRREIEDERIKMLQVEQKKKLQEEKQRVLEQKLKISETIHENQEKKKVFEGFKNLFGKKKQAKKDKSQEEAQIGIPEGEKPESDEKDKMKLEEEKKKKQEKKKLKEQEAKKIAQEKANKKKKEEQKKAKQAETKIESQKKQLGGEKQEIFSNNSMSKNQIIDLVQKEVFNLLPTLRKELAIKQKSRKKEEQITIEQVLEKDVQIQDICGINIKVRDENNAERMAYLSFGESEKSELNISSTKDNRQQFLIQTRTAITQRIVDFFNKKIFDERKAKQEEQKKKREDIQKEKKLAEAKKKKEAEKKKSSEQKKLEID